MKESSLSTQFASILEEHLQKKEISQKEQETKFDLPKYLFDLALDLAFVSAGGGIGSALRVPSLIKNTTTIARIISKVPRITGETVGLATADLLRGRNPEEALGGAVSGQLFGYGIVGASKLGYKALKKIKPVQSATEKTKDVVHSLVFGEELPKGTFETIHKSVSDVAILSSLLKSDADKEIQKLIKNQKDWNEILEISKNFVKRLRIIEEDRIDDIFKTLSHIDTYSAHPIVAAEIIKFVERKFPEVYSEFANEIKRLSKEYPVLFKSHDFIKYSDDAFSKVIASVEFDKAKEMLQDDIANLKILSDKLSQLLQKKFKLEQIDRSEVSEVIRQLNETKSNVLNLSRYFDKEDKRNLRKLIKLVDNLKDLFKRTTVKDIRYLNSIKSSMETALEKAVSLTDNVSNNIGILSKLSEQTRGELSEITNLLKALRSVIREPNSKNIISKTSPIIKNLKEKTRRLYKDFSTKKFTKEEQSLLSSLYKNLKNINKSGKSIVSILSKAVVKPPIYEKKLTEILEKIMKSSVDFKTVKNQIEDLHHMYYTRITMPPKFTKELPEVQKVMASELDLENIFTSFRQHIAESFSVLKERKYPLLIIKYADDLQSGYKVSYRTMSQNLSTELTKTYMLAPALLKVKQLLEVMAENPKFVKTFIPEGYIGVKGYPIYLVVKNPKYFDTVDKNIMRQYYSLTLGDETYFIYRPLLQALGHAVDIATGSIVNIFGKGILTTANTLMKRLAVWFSLIHLKALTTAGIGIGKGKTVLEAWKSFISKGYFEESVTPMLKEVADKISKYELKTTLTINAYDDIREHFSRMLATNEFMRKTLNNPVVKPFMLAMKPIFNIVNEFDKALWERMFYTLKLGSAREIIEQFEKGIIPKHVAEDYLNKLGSVFGGNWEWLYMKPQTREMIRLLTFAPDWYLTLIRHFTGSVKGHDMFADFFRKIFIIHYIIANELNWSLNGKSSWENFIETKNWKDLFRVPLYYIDPNTKHRKAAYISPLGFEIEGSELIGVLFLYDALIESMTTAKTYKECVTDALLKWKNYIFTKSSSVLRFFKDLASPYTSQSINYLVSALPKPIMVNMWGKIVDRNVTLAETGLRVPPELIFILHQFGLKYHANEELSERMYSELMLKTDKETAKRINEKFRKEITNIVTAMNRSYKHLSYPLKSDNPNRLYTTSIESVIRKYIKKNYFGDIKSAVKSDDMKKLLEIKQKIYKDLEGTALSYNYNFKKLTERVYNRLVRNIYKERGVLEIEE